MKSNLLVLTIINNFLNNYFYQLLIFFLFIRGEFALISQITILIAPLVFFKDSFSSNQRILLISDKKFSLFTIFFKKRIIYLVIILIPYIILFFILDKTEKNLFILTISICTLLLWLNELKLTLYEIELDVKKLLKSLFFLLGLYLYVYICTIYYNKNLLYIFLIFLFLFFIKNIFKYKINLFSISKNIFRIKAKINYKLFSTISTNSVNLIWRFIIFNFLEKDFSGIVFSIFAFASFPPSFYNNSIGMTFEMNKKKKFRLKAALLMYYVLIILLIYYIFLSQIIPIKDINLNKFYLFTATFSIFGSLIMLFSISKRIKILNYRKQKRNLLFKLDIFYSILNLLSIMVIYYAFGSLSFHLLLFISSILSLVYFIYFRKLEINENV
jgi:hypothetical protein